MTITHINIAKKYLSNLGLEVESAFGEHTIEITVSGRQSVRSKFVRDSINKMREFGWELVDLMNLGSTWRAVFEPIKEDKGE
jgi:hypothetical protein